MNLVKLYCCVSLLSIAANSQIYKNEIGIRSDNDAYTLETSDKYYTNGLFVNYRRAVNQKKIRVDIEKKIYEISAGQQIFNPYSGYAPDPKLTDRPFAGYLYVGGKLSWYYINESILEIGAKFGSVGSNSMAEEAQETIHSVLKFYEVAGWEYQIKNEITVNLSGQFTKLLYRIPLNSLDFSFEGYANLGTTFSGAGAGILIRGCQFNQLFNSSYTNAVVGNNAKTTALVKREFFFYAKPQLNYVAYNATIEGSMFNSNDPVTFGIKKIVFAQQLGINFSSQRFTADLGVILKTKEVNSLEKAHRYGYISFLYRFN